MAKKMQIPQIISFFLYICNAKQIEKNMIIGRETEKNRLIEAFESDYY